MGKPIKKIPIYNAIYNSNLDAVFDRELANNEGLAQMEQRETAPILDYIEGAEQDASHAKKVIASRMKTAEDALIASGIAIDSVAGKILRLVVRVTGYEPLSRTRDSIARDIDVKCAPASVPRAIKQLEDCGLLKRSSLFNAAGNCVGMALQADRARILERSTEGQNLGAASGVETACATGSATRSAPVALPVALRVAPSVPTIAPFNPISPPPLDAEWKAVEEELIRLSVAKAPEAIKAARSRNVTPDYCKQLIAFYRAWKEQRPSDVESWTYVLYRRILIASNETPVESGWIGLRDNSRIKRSMEFNRRKSQAVTEAILSPESERSTGFSEEDWKLLEAAGLARKQRPLTPNPTTEEN